jgi:hypothetical protein
VSASVARPQRSTRIALVVGTVALAAFHLWASSRIGGPSVVFDESGYLGNARWLAGGSTWEMPRSPTYAVGYPVLLAPVMAIADGADTQWRGVLAVNAVLLASVFPLLAKVLADVFGVPWRRATAVALVGAMAPAVIAAGISAIAENLVLPLVLALVLAAHAMADRSPSRAAWSRHAFGLTVAALVTTHPRFTLGVVVALAVLVAAGWTRLVARRVAAANAVLLVAGAIAGSALGRAVVAARWSERERLEGGPSAWFDLATSERGLRELALTAIGQGWYLAVGSIGLSVIGVLVAVRVVRSDSSEGAQRFAVAVTLAIAASVFATSVLFFAQNQFRADHWVYGRHNDSFTPLLVSVGLASLLAIGPRAQKLRDLATAFTVIAVLGAIVAIARDPVDLKSEFSPFAVPAIARWAATSPDSMFALASVIGGLGVVALATVVLVSLTPLRHPSRAVALGDRSLGVGLAVVVLVGWSVYLGWAAVDGTAEFESVNSAGWDSPAQVERLGLTSLAIEERAAKSLPTLTYPFHLPGVDVTTYSERPGDEPVGPFLLARLDDLDRVGAGDRVALLDEGGFYGFFGAPQGLAVWVRPGPEQDRLAADGLLLPAGFPAPLPSSARVVELAWVGSEEPLRPVRPGGWVEVEVSARHAGTGSPWPDAASFGLDGRVQVQARVEPIDPTADLVDGETGRLPAPGSGELTRWTRPGDRFTTTVRVHALDQRLRPLAPGSYRVVLGVGQAGGAWFAPASTPDGAGLEFELRVG